MSSLKDYKTLAIMHNAPRFWHTNNIAVLASRDESAKQDYVDGVIAFASFLMCFFAFWAIVMIYFKIRGIRNYGCWAGQVTYGNKDESEKARAYTRYRKIQNMFILSTCGLIISCSLFLRKGLPYLDQAAIDIKELNSDFRYTILEGKDIASLTDQGLQEIRVSMATLTNITDTDQYCQTRNGLDEFNMTFYKDDITDNVKGLQDFVTTYGVEALNFNLNSLLTRSYGVETVLDSYTKKDWLGKMFAMVIIVLTSFLMVYIVAGLCSLRAYSAEAMVSYFVLPSFILALSIGWIVTAIFGAGSTMNADFCYGDGIDGPEATVQDALRQYGISDDHIIFHLFLYYKNECTQVNTWEVEITKIMSYLRSAISAAESFISQKTQVQVICGEKVVPIVNTFETLKQQLKNLSFAFERGIDIARCERVMPLYRRLFNGATCKESLIGLSWAFYSTLALSIFGVLLVSSRAALYKIKFLREENTMHNIVNHHESTEDWNEKQSTRHLEHLSQKNRQRDSQITFSASDEEYAVQLRSLEHESDSLSPTTIRSNQSTIDSNDCFRDDEVNSFNEELEPLTPSPRASSQCSTVRSSSFFP